MYSVSSEFNECALSPTGLQHPRQWRAALSGTLQSTPRPPRAGTVTVTALHPPAVTLLEAKGDRLVLLKAAQMPPASSRRDLSPAFVPYARCVGLPVTSNQPLEASPLCLASSRESELLHVNRLHCGGRLEVEVVVVGGVRRGRNVLGLSFTSPAGKRNLI